MKKINQIGNGELSVCIRCDTPITDIAGTIIGTFNDWEKGTHIDNFYGDLCSDCLKSINDLIENGVPVVIASKSIKEGKHTMRSKG